MYSGISGMKNFQTKLDVIGNNIANVNTFGYKKGRITFKDTMNQMISGASTAQNGRGGKNPMQVGLGSAIASIDTIDTQGSVQTTGRALDLAVSGDGYFVVKQGSQEFYSRAGNFYLDQNGTLVNTDGLKVQSYKNGLLQDINVNVNSLLPAKQSANISMQGNLPEDAKGQATLIQQIQAVDNNGVAHTVEMTIKPIDPANGKWNVSFVDNTLKDPIANTLSQDITIPPYDPNSPPPDINIQLKLNDGSGNPQPLDLTLSIKDLTKNAGNMDAQAITDGNTEGSLESFNISSSGEVNGVFSNGLVMPLGRLALAKFSNPSGLEKAGGNLFRQSVNSGLPNIDVAGNGRGTIMPGSLEMSNVDLSEEFTDMITAQRGFQANTKIITTSDEILQELVNLKR
jgi:flagellar hook protein FlgE